MIVKGEELGVITSLPFLREVPDRAEGCQDLMQKPSSVPKYQPSVTANKLSATASSPEAAPPLSFGHSPNGGALEKGAFQVRAAPALHR